jgi:hypothetical protein
MEEVNFFSLTKTTPSPTRIPRADSQSVLLRSASSFGVKGSVR